MVASRRVVAAAVLAVAACLTPASASADGPTRPGRVGAGAGVGPGEHLIRLRHAGVDRHAVVHVPAAAALAGSSLPALFHFPGMFETPEIADASAGLAAFADRAGYLLVIPEHEGIGWQGVPGGQDAPSVDDPGFVRALTDLVVARYGADPSRLYASGMSNGGLFTQGLACRYPDRFAAFATVAGSAPGVGCPSRPPAPVPMLVIHGREDKVINYGQAEAGARGWADAAGCAQTTLDTPLPDRDRADGTTVIRHEFTGCPSGTPVILDEIVGGGHLWPGGDPLLPGQILGRGNGDLDANEAIWAFVSRFRLHP